MRNLSYRKDLRPGCGDRALVALLCACTLVALTAARATHLPPGQLQHVICKAPTTVPTYSWLSDAPDFAVGISGFGFRLAVSAGPIRPVPQLGSAPRGLVFSQDVRPPPGL